MTVLSDYQKLTQQLLSDLKQEIANILFVNQWINIARRQLCGESECLRVLGTISTTIGQRVYNFSSITLGVTGVQAPLNVRSLLYSVGGGQQWVTPRNWEWFQLYMMSNPVPDNGPPSTWSQYAQGALGSFYLDPIPDVGYNLTVDCTCYPVDLVDDTTVEAIPVLWTDAVPYYAAYWGYTLGQNAEKANMMMTMYKTFVERARKAANPPVNRWLYSQAGDPTMIAKLGLQQKAGANGQS